MLDFILFVLIYVIYLLCPVEGTGCPEKIDQVFVPLAILVLYKISSLLA